MKVGDKVKIVRGAYLGHSVGDVGIIIDVGSGYDFRVEVNGEGRGDYNEHELQLIEEKTMNPYKKGQVLVDKDGNAPRTVIEVLGDLVFVSTINKPEVAFSSPSHYKEFEENHTIQNTTDLKELTLEDIAQKFNLPVDKIRIKE